jgi:YD repeat-containing protein
VSNSRVNMIKTFLLVLCVLAVTAGVLSVSVRAQSQMCSAMWIGCGPTSLWNMSNNCPPEAFNCQVGGGPWLIECQVQPATCPPAGGKDETCSGCNGGPGGGGPGGGGPGGGGPGGGGPGGAPGPFASSPINLATGNTFIRQTDIRIPGLSAGLTLARTWNSKWPSTQTAFQVGIFGPNWRSTFEERVFVGSDNYVKYAREDGSFWSFGFASGGMKLAAPANVSATLVQGSTYWTLTFQNGEQRLFDNTSGSLIAIIDRNGNTTQLSYDSLNRLVTVTDPASRHLTFTYQSPSSYLVTSVSADVGLSVSYAYDAQNRLSQVTNQDSTTLTFTYDSQSRITSVTDSSGKVLESHTYDSSSRGLTGTRALDVEAVTISYPNP